MEGEGFRVLRVPASDISKHLEGVLAMIAKVGAERLRELKQE